MKDGGKIMKIVTLGILIIVGIAAINYPRESIAAVKILYTGAVSLIGVGLYKILAVAL